MNLSSHNAEKLEQIILICQRWDNNDIDAYEAMALIEYTLDKDIVEKEPKT